MIPVMHHFLLLPLAHHSLSLALRFFVLPFSILDEMLDMFWQELPYPSEAVEAPLRLLREIYLASATNIVKFWLKTIYLKSYNVGQFFMPLYSIGNQIPTSFISISIESISIFSSPFSSINLEHVDSDISSLLSSWSALSFSFSSFRLRVEAIFANSSTLSNLASSPSPYKGMISHYYLIFGCKIRINI